MGLVEPNLRRWSKDDYPEGVIGHEVFPPELDRRKRLDYPLTLPPEDYILGIRSRVVLADHPIETVGDLLQAPTGDLFNRLKRQSYLETTFKRLNRLLEGVLFSPDDRLMKAVFGIRDTKAVLIDPETEDLRGKVIRDLVGRLPGDQSEVLDRMFGLTDWRPLRPWLDLAANQLGRSRRRTLDLEEKGLRHLRRHKDSLELFLPAVE